MDIFQEAKDPQFRKRLAKYIALHCFRNSELENLHAGIFPSSKLAKNKKYNDVKVVSPFGEIPFKKVSRISDAEMKVLMKNVVNLTYIFLSAVCNEQWSNALVKSLKDHDHLPEWAEPKKSYNITGIK